MWLFYSGTSDIESSRQDLKYFEKYDKTCITKLLWRVLFFNCMERTVLYEFLSEGFNIIPWLELRLEQVNVAT